MKTIMIDPGHGGSDPGATYKGNVEKTLNLLTALAVRDYLLSHFNVNVMMTRTDDQSLSLTQRSNLANRTNPDFFLSIHHNAGGGSGFESYVYNGSVPSQTLTYQTIIHDEVMAGIKPSYNVLDRGKKRANFHVLRETKLPSLLLEILFIDNPADVVLLNNSNFRSATGAAIGKGVGKALGLPAKIVNEKELFKVIAGSFSDRENADIRVAELKQRGISSFIDSVVVSGTTFYRVQTGAFADRDNAENQVAALKKIGVEAFILVRAGSDEPKPPTPAPTEPPKPTQPPQPTKPPGVQYSILGASLLKSEQLDDFAKSVNPTAPLLGKFYIYYGDFYGIRGDVAFAQAIHETNYFRFTGQVNPNQHNYAGIGTTGPGNDGASFKTPEEGVLAHIQHLYAYSSKNPLPQGATIVDPRFSLVTRGSALNWTDLNGKWAVPGTTYGQSVLSVYSMNIQNALKGIENQKVMLNNALGKLK
ncbi:sporulation protein [Bacillus sp. BHET2]|uniref:N-acetylmuramoyl-L-alanine amidase n=1 Tax=Bacillus sp. BHET2 TaxID=2583818 RepID=UPI00110D49AE|nr:N-acetylmuramoyl-L-alanine amidase [Bacillus sp. BHET2]TMU87545.1 sporulation protein [Bacillus sp. BHET2]